MPILGTIERGTINLLLDSARQAQANAVLKLQTPQHNAEIHIESGEISSVVNNQQLSPSSLSLLQASSEGSFLVYRIEEKPQPSTNFDKLSIWLLDQNIQRRDKILQQLQLASLSVALVVDHTQLLKSLQLQQPKLLLLDAKTALEHQHTLLTPQSTLHSQHFHTVLIGTQRPLPHQLENTISGWFRKPFPPHTLQAWLQKTPLPTHNPHLFTNIQLDSKALPFLYSLPSTFAPRLRLQLNPKNQHLLQPNEAPPDWLQWLNNIDPQKPILRQATPFPAPAQITPLILQHLLHTKILQPAQELQNNSPIAASKQPNVQNQTPPHSTPPPHSSPTPRSTTPPHSTPTDIINESFVFLKVITIGLKGLKREQWIESLQQISQTQASRISQLNMTKSPQLRSFEIARVPLRSDSLLIVYQAKSEHHVEQIIQEVGTDLTSFLFFFDLQNQKTIQATRQLRQKLLRQYPLPDLVLVPKTDNANLEKLNIEIGLNAKCHIIQEFNTRNSYKLLRMILLKTNSKQNTTPT